MPTLRGWAAYHKVLPRQAGTAAQNNAITKQQLKTGKHISSDKIVSKNRQPLTVTIPIYAT